MSSAVVRHGKAERTGALGKGRRCRMSSLSMSATRLYRASELLTPYVLALESIRVRGGQREPEPGEAKSILDVLAPLDLHLRGMNYYNLGIDGERISEFLHSRHGEGWPRARDGLLAITARFKEGGRVPLSDLDMTALNDVADALDYVCDRLFQETRRR